MCGICGIVQNDGRAVDPRVVGRMVRELIHRGPDGSGIYVNKSVGLGHTRLAIIDISGGSQPMKTMCGNLCITFNGEIYNYIELRNDLIRRGYTFSTESDTEVILNLFQEFGDSCLDHLRGMFAFAIWDEKKRRLFLARDRFGIKPLYYWASDSFMVFASEIKALLVTDKIEPQLNLSALPDYLANRGTSDDQTLFHGIKRLEPGSSMSWVDGRVEHNRYWDLSFQSCDSGRALKGSDGDLVEEWGRLFDEAVKLHMIADVPIGVFLSGGIDSSSILASMTKESSSPIKSFSVGFSDADPNELDYARSVARYLGSDHHEVSLTAAQFFDAVPRLIWHEDEPLASASSVPLYFVSKLASEQARVVLSGEGADELLCGYARYRKTAIQSVFARPYYRLVPRAARKSLAWFADCLARRPRTRQWLRRTFLHLGPDIESVYWDNFSVFSRAMQQSLLNNDVTEAIGSIDPYLTIRRYHENIDTESNINRMLYADTKTHLHELLMKQDQMSMAASIESRVPFLDHKLAEFTARLPVRLKLQYGIVTKKILRLAMSGRLPKDVLCRRKFGFPVPVGSWIRHAYRDVLRDILLSSNSRIHEFCDLRFILNLIHRHESGEDHTERLWMLMNLEIWMQRAMPKRAAPDAQFDLRHEGSVFSFSHSLP